EPVERADAGREIVQTGEVLEITAVATEQDFTQVHEAVDRLSDGGEGAGCRALPMCHLAVVLESGDVVGGGLQAQHEAEFVIDLDRGFAETMPDAGPLDPRCELTADLLGELSSDPVAEEGGDVFGFDSEDGLPGKLLIERFEDGWRAEHQIRGVLNLHETPMVGLSEHIEHRTGRSWRARQRRRRALARARQQGTTRRFSQRSESLCAHSSSAAPPWSV